MPAGEGRCVLAVVPQMGDESEFLVESYLETWTWTGTGVVLTDPQRARSYRDHIGDDYVHLGNVRAAWKTVADTQLLETTLRPHSPKSSFVIVDGVARAGKLLDDEDFVRVLRGAQASGLNLLVVFDSEEGLTLRNTHLFHQVSGWSGAIGRSIVPGSGSSN